MSRENDRDLL